MLGVLIIILTNHGDTVLWMNEIHGPFLNTFFKIWTYGGDGILFGAVALTLLIAKRRFGIVFLVVGAVQGLISALMKRVIFKGTPRPRKYFEGREVLDLIDGVKVHDFNSFPSGHTMTAFAIAAFLALMTENSLLKLGLLLSACLVGISRIYLNQHFLVDVVVGSLLGVFVCFICSKLFEKYLNLNMKN